jgi:nicotinamide-nucleotide amidase
MDSVFAVIITIGDELLIGQVIDTNSAFIAQELNKQGILVKQRIAVGDQWDDIWHALNEAQKLAKLIIITGGLGPTADDITKPLLCKYFDGKMIVHQPTLNHLTHIFEKLLKKPMIERNAKQAEVPDTCQVLMNEKGTAPGMLFEKNNIVFVSLPGVPHEMKWLMQNKVIPMIPGKFKTGHVVHQTLLTAGIGESFLAEQIKEVEEKLPTHIKLAYLPNYGMVRLRLSGYGFDKETIEKEVSDYFSQLKEACKTYVAADEDIPLHEVIGKLLMERKQTLSTAESCSGGYIAHLLTSIAGSSAYFEGSVVCYSYDIKEKVLGVKHDTLLKYGAVSEETVTEMVSGALKLLETDYAVAVSGIMGPGGGLPDKPVGTVWVAVASKEKIVAQKFYFRFDRKRNIELTSNAALNMLRLLICG